MQYREFTIPKKSKGVRKITAPDKELLAYQRNLLPMLELLWQDIASDYEIDHIQHGFLPNRNCVTAASRHIGYRTTISMDIADFFDNVTKEKIAELFPALAENPHLYHKDGYCSQGFATSPILCNIALIPTLAEINKYLQELCDNEFEFTVYADDVTISINEENHDKINKIIEDIVSIIQQNNFDIKASKTRIRYAKYGFRRILGIMVGDTIIKVPRKTKYRLRAAIHQKNGPSIGGLTTWSRLLLPKVLR